MTTLQEHGVLLLSVHRRGGKEQRAQQRDKVLEAAEAVGLVEAVPTWRVVQQATGRITDRATLVRKGKVAEIQVR